MKHLSKKYRLVYNKRNEVVIFGKFEDNSEIGCLNGFDFDTLDEMEAKLNELGLTFPEGFVKEI